MAAYGPADVTEMQGTALMALAAIGAALLAAASGAGALAAGSVAGVVYLAQIVADEVRRSRFR